MRILILLSVVVASVGCMARTSIRDTKTLHNADASRIWVVQQDGEDQKVVMCDTEMFKVSRKLCVRWPSEQ